MKRLLILGCAIGLSALALANPADACHHRRARRQGCGGCGNGGYAPTYYDGKGSYQDYGPSDVPSDVPAPPAPPPPAPRAT